MLEEKVLKEDLLIKDGVPYAYIKETNEKRKLDGCKVRKEINEKIYALTVQKEEHLNIVEEINKKLLDLQTDDGLLQGNKYCKCDFAVFKRIDGIALRDENGRYIIDHYTHQQNCPRKENK